MGQCAATGFSLFYQPLRHRDSVTAQATRDDRNSSRSRGAGVPLPIPHLQRDPHRHGALRGERAARKETTRGRRSKYGRPFGLINRQFIAPHRQRPAVGHKSSRSRGVEHAINRSGCVGNDTDVIAARWRHDSETCVDPGGSHDQVRPRSDAQIFGLDHDRRRGPDCGGFDGEGGCRCAGSNRDIRRNFGNVGVVGLESDDRIASGRCGSQFHGCGRLRLTRHRRWIEGNRFESSRGRRRRRCRSRGRSRGRRRRCRRRSWRGCRLVTTSGNRDQSGSQETDTWTQAASHAILQHIFIGGATLQGAGRGINHESCGCPNSCEGATARPRRGHRSNHRVRHGPDACEVVHPRRQPRTRTHPIAA